MRSRPRLLRPRAVSPTEPFAAPGGVSNEGVIRSGKLAGLTMWQAIWILAWPVLVESFLTAMVGLVDTTLSAGIDEAATDAIGVASYFQWFIGLVGVSLGVGATALIARSIGRGRVAVANAALGQVVLLAGLMGVVVGAGIALAAPAIASAMQLSDEAAPLAIRYLRITAIGVPFVTLLMAGNACCRAAGDSLSPLRIMMAVNVVNIVTSFLLSGVDIQRATPDGAGGIERHMLLPNPVGVDLGIDGIAYGTLAAWAVGGLLLLVLLARGTHGLRLLRRRLRPHLHTIRRLVRVGVPNFLETFGMWFGNFATILLVGAMATPGLYGAHVVAIRIEAFSFMPGFAMALAASTLAGQYLGAGSPRLARLAVFRCSAVASGIMACFSAAFLLAPAQIVGIFSQQPLHMELTPRLLVVCGVVQIPFAIAIVMRGAMRGAGDTYVAMCLTWLSTYGIRLPLAWLGSGVDIELPGGPTLVNPAPLRDFGIEPLVGLWIGMCTEIVLRSVLFVARFVQGGWARVRV